MIGGSPPNLPGFRYELDEWTARFLDSGENGLKSDHRDEFARYGGRIKELWAKVGELVLERDVLNESQELRESYERTS